MTADGNSSTGTEVLPLIEARPDFAPNDALPRHRWYRFKEGFSAQLVRAFSAQHMPESGGWLLDPFLGSGTTAVEGAAIGHHVHGVETNPFMAFLAKVKTRDYSKIHGIEAATVRCIHSKRRDPRFTLPRNTTLVERKGLEKWILNRSVALRYEQLYSTIAATEPILLRDLLLLALISSVEEVANARKDGKCWRYRQKWQNRDFDAKALDEAFAGRIVRFIEDIELSPQLTGTTKIKHFDARDRLCSTPARQVFDGLLTSPPYLNSFDYTDIYRPELFLMRAATNSSELRELRFRTVRSHVQVAWKPTAALEIPILRDCVSGLSGAGLWCGRIPEMVDAYFYDLDRVVSNCARRLKRGASAGFVVADSAYGGKVVPVGSILREILTRRGFHDPTTTILRRTLGNGHHQQRSGGTLSEVIVVAEYDPGRN